jgi:hypothetical protein
MTDLQKEFEATGRISWINADLYPDCKIYTQEYIEWLERQVLALRQPPVIGLDLAEDLLEQHKLRLDIEDDHHLPKWAVKKIERWQSER